METRKLGAMGLEVSALGLGCMGMTGVYGAPDEAEAIATIQRAAEVGITLLDTSDMYGRLTNEQLVGRAIKGRRAKLIIATKFGFNITEDGTVDGVNSHPDYVRRACDASLRRLGIDTIDLYYQHRVDPDVPIEETVGAMADLVRQGKVRFLGLSEAGPQTIRRAHAIHPISALQTEYSLWERGVEERVLPTIRELGIGFVPYSPLGRGFLGGRITRFEDLADDDGRRNMPRFQGANLEKNLLILAHLERVAAAKHATPAQVALAWLLSQGSDIVPIPGTKRRSYLQENVQAVDIMLNPEEMAALESAAPIGAAAGARLPEEALRRIEH